MKIETRVKKWISADMKCCEKWINFSHDISSLDIKKTDLELALMYYQAVERQLNQLNNWMLKEMGDF